MSASLDIRLKRTNKIYHEGEILTGVIVFDCKSESRHEGIILAVEGNVNMQLSSKNSGLFDNVYNVTKPIPLIGYSFEAKKSGRLPSGKTEIPFELPLQAKPNRSLYETYHGVFIQIQYYVRCDVRRSMLNKDLQKAVEFIIEGKSHVAAGLDFNPLNFEISPDSLQNQVKSQIPRFKVHGSLDGTICRVSDPFTGELIVDYCDVPIRSIELQLVRVESCGGPEGGVKDATEIQNIQIGDGDVCRNVPIPVFMVFPRLFTCPTLTTNGFKIEFEVNVVVIFEDNHLVTENFPIKMIR
ncbi:hypothetical protein HDE_05219 [Halotydeus destructor]|nr:hypothetical protein HDE_05219 [Halotydeus destructor]